MKKLLLSLLLASSLTAHAEIIALLANNAGGMMHFTDAQCSSKSSPYWKVIYSLTKDGKSIFGCWMYADNMVHVHWDSGSTSAFYAADLTLVPKEKNDKSYKY